MYWIFLIIFIVAVLVPDIVRKDFLTLSETRIEEILIFLMGILAFSIFIKNEQQIIFHKREKEKDKIRIEQTVKDLVESYSYIGEVNRKMDILMSIALGLADRKALTKNQESETYHSIVSAAGYLLKADLAALRFVDETNAKTVHEFKSEDKKLAVKNKELPKTEGKINVKKISNYLIISSSQEIRKIRSHIIIKDYDKNEENSPKNIEILKVFASQALFVYSYIHSEETYKPLSFQAEKPSERA